MGFITVSDGAQIFYKDWGDGPPVLLSHGWPLNSDSWEAQQLFLAGNQDLLTNESRCSCREHRTRQPTSAITSKRSSAAPGS